MSLKTLLIRDEYILRITWFLISFFMAIGVVHSSTQVFPIPTTDIAVEQYSANALRALEALPQLYVPLEAFDNFFPLSAISRINLVAHLNLQTNAVINVTNPSFSDSFNQISVYCGGDKDVPKFLSGRQITIPAVRPQLINYELNSKFECQTPQFELQYLPQKIIEVGPNEFVQTIIHGDKLVVNVSGLIMLEPTNITKLLIFVICFVIAIGAGSLLFSFFSRMHEVYSR
jgi:hypothetical protein